MAKETKSSMTPEKRKEIVALTLRSIEKDFGVGSCQVLGEQKIVPIARVHSGSHQVNEVMGGGYPRGRIIEIFGPESSGKTTVALHAVAQVQKQLGLEAAYIDAEHALDLNYAKALGVDTKSLILAQPDTAEDCLQIAERWVRSGVCGVVVVDSVAAMVPLAEMKGDIGDSHIGLLARLMSQALRKLAGLALKTGTILIFINQLREKVGVVFGNPETTPGGRALKFYSSIRLDVRPKEIMKRGEIAVSRKTQIKAVKNKVAPPLRVTEVDIEFGEGISRPGELLDIGHELGLIGKSGNWYLYKDQKANGRDNAKQFLRENPEIMEELDGLINQMMYPEDVAEFVPQEIEEVEATLSEEEGSQQAGDSA